MQHARHSLLTLAPLVLAALLALTATFVSRPAAAGPDDAVVPKELQHVGVTEHLDAQLPLDTTFLDHTGKPVRLGDYFDGTRPVLLTFAYHTCPVLCSMVLNATIDGLRNVGWTIGKEFDVVTISIDPRDSLEKTAAKRASVIAQYKRPQAEQGMHFLVGDELNIKRTTDSMGFEYKYDAEQQQYAHPAVVMLLKPGGRVSRYLYGLEFSPKDLKIGLLEASEGKSISTVEKMILYCYRYDPHDGKYVVMAQNIMKLGGGMTMLSLGSFLGMFWWRERRKTKREAVADTSPHAPEAAE